MFFYLTKFFLFRPCTKPRYKVKKIPIRTIRIALASNEYHCFPASKSNDAVLKVELSMDTRLRIPLRRLPAPTNPFSDTRDEDL